MQTIVVDNFRGSMTQYADGDINSGYTNITSSFAYDPLTKPGNLTWNEEPEQIDPSGNVITDLVMAGKPRLESGVVYTYMIGHTGRLYKVQVNDPNTYDPNYDNPVLLTTLTINSPTFTRGGFLTFFGATEKIYISHDKGVTSVNFDGTGEAFVGVLGSWTQNVPKPIANFLGSLFIGNGTNLAQIDSTATVTTYAKLSPAFPINTQVRDLDVTPNGNYVQAVVSEAALPDITVITPDTSLLVPANSYVFLWNGTDPGYTSYTTYPSAVLSANAIFGNYAYAFGYDYLGGALYNPTDKFITSLPSSPYSESPFPNAVIGMSNTITWITTLPFEGNSYMVYSVYGTIASQGIQTSYWSPLSVAGTGDQTDVVHVPCQILVSNYGQGPSTNGYTNGLFGAPKIYYSTIESSSAPTTAYKLYKWSPVPTGLGTTYVGGVYQTQSQIFGKKVTVKEVRVYGEPWVANNSFTIDLIGADGVTPISGGSKTFTASANAAGIATSGQIIIGQDYGWYTPEIAPTFVMGLSITNNGTANHTITKIEIDVDDAGK